jgi:hypothetical protein
MKIIGATTGTGTAAKEFRQIHPHRSGNLHKDIKRRVLLPSLNLTNELVITPGCQWIL